MKLDERMAKGLLWTDTKPYLVNQMRIKGLVQKFNALDPADAEGRNAMMKEMFGHVGEHVYIAPGLNISRGDTVSIGDGTYINWNCAMVDDWKITIGRGVLIAPNVTICTCNHPLNYKARPQGQMFCKEVVIEDNVWICTGAIICPGVRIGQGAVIAAGSVVTKDVPPMTFAGGNPCKVIREITDEDVTKWEGMYEPADEE